MKLYIILFLPLFFCFLGCSNFSGLTEVENDTNTENHQLFHSIYGDLSVASLQQNAKATNTSLKIDADGHAILYYNGEVIRPVVFCDVFHLAGNNSHSILDTLWLYLYSSINFISSRRLF